MASFSQDEIFTATEVVRNFSNILTRVSKSQIKRAVIVKNNRFEAVILNMAEYERLNEAVSVLEAIYKAKRDKNGE